MAWTRIAAAKPIVRQFPALARHDPVTLVRGASSSVQDRCKRCLNDVRRKHWVIRQESKMNPFIWLIWINETIAAALRPPRRRPALRVIEGGRKHAMPRALRMSGAGVIRQVW
jgi:hypothetical protein